jgi:uncharacterized membrane protein YkvA (DUF1232 family)
MYRLFRLWRRSGRDLRLLWFALQHQSRPVWLLPAAGLLALYALGPFNFALPFLGVVDDFIVLPLALGWLAKLLPGEIRNGFDQVRGKPCPSGRGRMAQ